MEMSIIHTRRKTQTKQKRFLTQCNTQNRQYRKFTKLQSINFFYFPFLFIFNIFLPHILIADETIIMTRVSVTETKTTGSKYADFEYPNEDKTWNMNFSIHFSQQNYDREMNTQYIYRQMCFFSHDTPVSHQQTILPWLLVTISGDILKVYELSYPTQDIIRPLATNAAYGWQFKKNLRQAKNSRYQSYMLHSWSQPRISRVERISNS